MKIISNRECYIQKDDLDYLINNNVSVPNEVFDSIRNQETDFIKIENDKAIEFILNSSIPSFEEFNSLSDNKIKRLIFKIKASLFNDYDGQKMSDEELKQLILEEKNKRYMLQQLIEIINYRKGKSNLTYPDIPNPNRVSVTNGIMNASYSLNYDNILIYNIDGSVVSDQADKDFCNIAYKLLMHDYMDTENVELDYTFNDKYIILKNKVKKLINKK